MHAASRAKAEDCKVAIEAEGLADSQPLDECEARTVDQAEVLVAEVARDDPGPLQVLRLYRRKGGGASPDRAPKTQGSLAAEAGAEEQPAFRQDEITRDEVGASKLLRDTSGGSVRPISSVRQPIESTGIDEDRRH